MDGTIRGWKRYLSVQPPVTLYLFAVSLSGNILTQLIVHRSCTVTLGINRSECQILEENSSSPEALRIDAMVQPQASLILSGKSFVDSILPACLSLILGAWSDQFGRRPLLLIGYAGGTLTFLALSVLTSWQRISPWYVLLAYLPSAFLGGFCIVILATICYVNDITAEEERAWHLAWLEAAISVGVLAGMLLGPVIFKQYGYTPVFTVGAASCLLGGAYVWYCVPETVLPDRRIERGWKSLLDTRLIRELASSCTKRRDGFDRCAAWCCISGSMILVINMQGGITIGYLFANARLGWNVTRYSVYSAVNMSLLILGTIVGATLLRKVAGISEEAGAILALLSSISENVIRAFAWKPWQMYLAIGIGILGSLAAPSIRAMLARCVPAQDRGKVFSVTTSVETLTPFVASSFYSMLYLYSMPPRYPSAVWLVCAALYLLVAGLVLTVWWTGRKLNLPVGCGGSLNGSRAEEALLDSATISVDDADLCACWEADASIS